MLYTIGTFNEDDHKLIEVVIMNKVPETFFYDYLFEFLATKIEEYMTANNTLPTATYIAWDKKEIS